VLLPHFHAASRLAVTWELAALLLPHSRIAIPDSAAPTHGLAPFLGKASGMAGLGAPLLCVRSTGDQQPGYSQYKYDFVIHGQSTP
jgi:hypothetical protein